MAEERDIKNYPERTLLAFVEDPVVVLSRKGRVVYANPPFRRLFGLSREELAGRPAAETLPDWLAKPLVEQMAGLHPEDTHRHLWIGHERNRFRVSVAGIVIRGKVAGAAVSMWDARKELAGRRRNLEIYRSMLEDLAGPVEQAAFLLEKEGGGRSGPNPAAEASAQLKEGLARMREFGEVFLGDVTAESVPFYPGRLVNMALKSLRPMAVQQGVFLEEGMPRELPRVLGDPALLNRVLGLLLDYMIRSVNKGEAVIISGELLLDTDGRPGLTYSISGTGHVSGAAELSEATGGLLESYSDLADETKRSVLRLSLARRLVSGMEGTVTVAAHELAGTTISLRIPVEIHFGGKGG